MEHTLTALVILSALKCLPTLSMYLCKHSVVVVASVTLCDTQQVYAFRRHAGSLCTQSSPRLLLSKQQSGRVTLCDGGPPHFVWHNSSNS